jgi:hypothetical protein
MYRTCIFCAGDLGSNEAIEYFPVGARLAFDAFKGRLWAVCPRCGRWNLAPIEERWEAVEEAERLFSMARQRVQSENIGLARLRDGTRLVRVGSALPGELAAWRYGTELIKRRTKFYAILRGGVVATGAVFLGLPALLGAGLPLGAVNPIIQAAGFYQRRRADERVVLRLDAHESPTGELLTLRRRHLLNARLTYEGDDLALTMARPIEKRERFRQYRAPVETGPQLVLHGGDARRVASRAMVDYNMNGASKAELQRALDLLERMGTAERFIRHMAESDVAITPPTLRRRRIERAAPITPRRIIGTFRGERMPVTKYRDILGPQPARIQKPEALALEMALQDEAERRAMEGELAALEEAWREAESIARIADALPDEPPE